MPVPSVRPPLRQILRDLRDLPSWARASYLRSLLRPVVPSLAPASGPDGEVLVLCHGNILRSPFAAAMIRRELELRGAVPSVRSAGVLTHDGRRAHDNAVALAPRYGIALDEHRTTAITAEHVARAAVIVVMDRLNEAILLARYPDAGSRLLRLGDYDPQRPGEIRDPYGEGPEALELSYARIARAAREFARALCDGLRGGAGRGLQPRRALAAAAFGTPAVRVWRPFAQGSAALFLMHRFTATGFGAVGDSPADLARNLEFLRKQRYSLLSVDDIVHRLAGGEPLPARSVAFTIDDGYRDVLDVAAPVFEAYDCPYTVYLVTGFLDGRCWLWWDRVLYAFGYAARGDWSIPVAGCAYRVSWSTHPERRRVTRGFVEMLKGQGTDAREEAIAALEALGRRRAVDRPPPTAAALTWDEVRAMRARGASFGPHTDSHPILARCSPEQAETEVRRSVQRFTEELGSAPASFAYPNGTSVDFGDEHRAAVRAAGLRAAVAFDGGYMRAEHFARDPFSLPRLAYEGDPLRFRQLVSGVEQWRSGTWRR